MSSQFNFEAIGTHWQIDIYQELSAQAESSLLHAIRERINLFDSVYSRFRADSLITKISQEAGDYMVPDDAKPMMELYHELYKVTDGHFTPFISQALVDAGYDATYSLHQKKGLEVPPIWDDVIEYHHPMLHIKTPVLFDFGAAGKGYLVDIVTALLQEHGVTNFCVDAGGDMAHRGIEALRIGLEDPHDANKVIGIVELKNNSLCGSAGNRRKWQNFNHIINAKTLTSPKNILAIWTMATTTMLSDAISTCLFFVPADTLQQYDFEYVILYEDYSIETKQKSSSTWELLQP